MWTGSVGDVEAGVVDVGAVAADASVASVEEGRLEWVGGVLGVVVVLLLYQRCRELTAAESLQEGSPCTCTLLTGLSRRPR